MIRRRIIPAALGLVLMICAGGAAAAAAQADTIAASVSSTPVGPPLPDGFLGVSFEFRALHQYTGADPRSVDPVMVNLLNGLSPGSAPSVRVGGNSTDATWWPIRGVVPPGAIYYRLSPGWLRNAQALAADLRTKLILGINLAAGRPAIAAAEARAYLQGIGRRYIQALEIGNEPDLYGVFPWYRDRRGHLYRSRNRHYGLADYTQEYRHFSQVLPHIQLAGPSVSGPGWMRHLAQFIAKAPRLGMVTYHRYPLRACTTDPRQASFPTIPHLLADSSSAGLASGLAPFVAVAHRHHLDFRLTEINSASCQGTAGVSDTFASALWALDTMFNLAARGVDGVNFHMLPGSHYELFSPAQDAGGAWSAVVHPEYYGLYLFGQAFPVGAQLVRVSAPSGPTKVWATQAADGSVRVTMINQDPSAEHDVQLQIPGATEPGSLETLTAPSLDATSGVTLGGQSFGASTTSGTLGPPATTPVAPAGGVYTVPLPAGSAALLTLPGGAGGSGLAVR
ncbi:MAG TPA: glycosyl hydrolase family 79 C-terminal domain-containing protein [Solirubrobacteraceae bacterium]|nr:glycosyl hydrolase family 79 C-terminal domain-containing protein [Solirubrobacteraceae bacterium]